MADVELVDALPQVGGAQTITLDVTTGAAPLDVPVQDPSVWRVIINVTSGGTGGDEVLNLLVPTPDDNGGNRQQTGQQVLVQLVSQTDPADAIVVTAGGTGEFAIYNPQRGFTQYANLSRVALDYENANVVFAWLYYWWYCDPGATDFNFSGVSGGGVAIVPAFPVATDASGGQLSLTGGAGDGTGVGGDVRLTPGSGATAGNIVVALAGGKFNMAGLPTSNSGLSSGDWWNNSGVPNIVA